MAVLAGSSNTLGAFTPPDEMEILEHEVLGYHRTMKLPTDEKRNPYTSNRFSKLLATEIIVPQRETGGRGSNDSSFVRSIRTSEMRFVGWFITVDSIDIQQRVHIQ